MILKTHQKNFILNTVKEKIAKRQNIGPAKAHEIVINSSLNKKIIEAPTFIAHCSVDQLVDLVMKEVELTSF
ncbi:MAG: hypothetical protein KAX49_07730 [Halanaerobiales bacterium]|nr:hypothetical protein [Halanaerobiales bacterium]